MNNSIGGCIAILKLPANTAFSIDGSESKILRTDEELLVFGHLPAGLHLLTIRAARRNSSNSKKNNESAMSSLDEYPTHNNNNNQMIDNNNNNNIMAMQTIGLLVYIPEKEQSHFFLARTFDPVLEELSSKDDDIDDITMTNLMNAIQHQNEHVDKSKLIHYQSIITQQGRESVWKQHLTNWIDPIVLRQHHLTGKGDKIIPGAYSNDNYDIEMTMNRHSTNHSSSSSSSLPAVVTDGVSMVYDPIPCIDTKCRFQAHNGTKRYLANQSPSKRTELLIQGDNNKTGGVFFQNVLQEYYHNRYEELLGSMQLSFICFLCCSCLSSLEHWRDLIYMMSLVDRSIIHRYRTAFELFLMILFHQFSWFGNELLHEDIMEWQELIYAIRKLCQNCSGCTEKDSSLYTCSQNLMNHIDTIFGHDASHVQNNFISYEDEDDENDDDDEDSPVIVPLEEIEEALSRPTPTRQPTSDETEYAQIYPFLFASICPGEDILMACARILDEKTDVTLVREAAHYLDHVESKK